MQKEYLRKPIGGPRENEEKQMGNWFAEARGSSLAKALSRDNIFKTPNYYRVTLKCSKIMFLLNSAYFELMLYTMRHDQNHVLLI